jgi:hypothetical protein
VIEARWNVMAQAQKPDFVFRRNGRVHLNRRGRQFTWLLAAKVCALAVVMLDTPCSEVVWRVLAANSIRQFPLHFPFRASTCTITFQLESTKLHGRLNFGSPGWNLLYVSISAPINLRWTLHVWKICPPLIYESSERFLYAGNFVSYAVSCPYLYVEELRA